VPRFEPFAGVRYDPSRVRLGDVVAPPYDVISPEEQHVLQARSPYNAVRIDLPDRENGLDPYEAAARRFADWQADGILRRDAKPSLYGYRMTYSDATGTRRRTIGVVGSLGLEPPGTAGIFPHERTTPKAKSDRLQLLQTTKVNTSPIWALSLAKGLSDDLVAPPDSDAVVDADAVTHEMWPISDPGAIARITEAVSAAPMVIADGHHRFETALTYQSQRRADDVPIAGDRGYDSVMALVVELVDDQLSVQGIHRLIGGLSGDFDPVAALSRSFDLTATAPADATILDRMARTGSPALVTPAGTWLLRATPVTLDAAGQDLDSSRLEVALAAWPEHQVTYQHGWDLAVAAVDRGDARAAVLLRPVTVDQIASTGRGGDRMPPKTTFFWPKPRTGLVFREVAD
jgi:uncharacterized protein (DUF1015 family)